MSLNERLKKLRNPDIAYAAQHTAPRVVALRSALASILPMSFRSILIFANALLFMSVLAGCDALGWHSWTWRQKLTIAIETPSGLKSGSSVTEVSVSIPPRWWGLGDAAGAAQSSLAGEAVAVDLGGGQYVFALLRDYSHRTAADAFFPRSFQGRPRENVIRIYERLQSMREARPLPENLFPILVTFADKRDPTSLKRIQPQNMVPSLGNGYHLHSITISITDEHITRGVVNNLLPWLREVSQSRASLKGKPLHGLVSQQADPEIYLISPSDFSTELHQ